MRKLLWILGAMAAGIASAHADDAATAAPPAKAVVLDKTQLGARLKSVKLLIESSSAARQVDSSGIKEALDDRERARELHSQALAAFDAGDLPKATQLVVEASKTMFKAVRLAAPDAITADKKRNDFDQRVQSISALEDALKRISSEKKSGSADTVLSIDGMVRDAKSLSATDIDRARTTLDKAYLTAKLAVEKLRDGDTLVRSLKFDSKADEYRYELDRNDSHRMLINLLLDEKRKNGGIDAMVSQSVEEAARLRKNADELAAKGDYESAVQVMEQSTTALVRAIRSAGIYIPG